MTCGHPGGNFQKIGVTVRGKNFYKFSGLDAPPPQKVRIMCKHSSTNLAGRFQNEWTFLAEFHGHPVPRLSRFAKFM